MRLSHRAIESFTMSPQVAVTISTLLSLRSYSLERIVGICSKVDAISQARVLNVIQLNQTYGYMSDSIKSIFIFIGRIIETLNIQIAFDILPI